MSYAFCKIVIRKLAIGIRMSFKNACMRFSQKYFSLPYDCISFVIIVLSLKSY